MNIHHQNKKFKLNDKVKQIDCHLGLRLSEYLRENENLMALKLDVMLEIVVLVLY